MNTYTVSIRRMVTDTKWKEINRITYSSYEYAMQEFRSQVREHSQREESVKISCTEGKLILGVFSIK